MPGALCKHSKATLDVPVQPDRSLGSQTWFSTSSLRQLRDASRRHTNLAQNWFIVSGKNTGSASLDIFKGSIDCCLRLQSWHGCQTGVAMFHHTTLLICGHTFVTNGLLRILHDY